MSIMKVSKRIQYQRQVRAWRIRKRVHGSSERSGRNLDNFVEKCLQSAQKP